MAPHHEDGLEAAPHRLAVLSRLDAAYETFRSHSLRRGTMCNTGVTIFHSRGVAQKPTLGKKTERERNVDDVPVLVNAILDHQRREDSDVFLDPQVDEVQEGLTEIQWNPLQPSVDVTHSLSDLSESTLGACPC